MDNLAVNIEPWEQSRVEGGVCCIVQAVVNGTPLPDVLDLDEFFKSLAPLSRLDDDAVRRTVKTRKARKPVTVRCLPIFNCSCGCFGCGGYYVDVTVTADALVWENRYSPFMSAASAEQGIGEPLARWRYAFDWANVRDVAGELLAAIYTAQAHSPNGEVGYGAFGVEVTARLPVYLEAYEALSAVTATRTG
jgi:hypothetical protein